VIEIDLSSIEGQPIRNRTGGGTAYVVFRDHLGRRIPRRNVEELYQDQRIRRQSDAFAIIDRSAQHGGLGQGGLREEQCAMAVNVIASRRDILIPPSLALAGRWHRVRMSQVAWEM